MMLYISTGFLDLATLYASFLPVIAHISLIPRSLKESLKSESSESSSFVPYFSGFPLGEYQEGTVSILFGEGVVTPQWQEWKYF